MAALPIVADIMADELGWSEKVKAKNIQAAEEYVNSYAGRIPKRAGSQLREITYNDLSDVFRAIDTDSSGFIDRTEMSEIASVLSFPLSESDIDRAFHDIDTSGDGRISFEEFETWWNHADSDFKKRLVDELRVGSDSIEELRQMGGGTLLG